MSWVYLGCYLLACLHCGRLKDQPDRTLLEACHTTQSVAEPAKVSRFEDALLLELHLLQEVTPEPKRDISETGFDETSMPLLV